MLFKQLLHGRYILKEFCQIKINNLGKYQTYLQVNFIIKIFVLLVKIKIIENLIKKNYFLH